MNRHVRAVTSMTGKYTYRAVVEVFVPDVIDAFVFHNGALHTPERHFGNITVCKYPGHMCYNKSVLMGSASNPCREACASGNLIQRSYHETLEGSCDCAVGSPRGQPSPTISASSRMNW
jgi:hypothetical protein